MFDTLIESRHKAEENSLLPDRLDSVAQYHPDRGNHHTPVCYRDIEPTAIRDLSDGAASSTATAGDFDQSRESA
jgi:hypothetical protein